MISFGPEICNDFEATIGREWLETNGIGGFASSTVSCANTRRYHGLLTAAMRPPLGRVTTLSKFEETILIDNEPYEISSNEYPGTVHPEGFQYLRSFRLDPFPIWIYEIDGIEIERRIFMVNGQNTTVAKWRVLSKVGGRARDLSLKLKPLLSFVDYHALQQESGDLIVDYASEGDVITLEPEGEAPQLYFKNNSVELENAGYWYRNFEYRVEKYRGFDHSEDLFLPFSLNFDLADDAFLVVSTDPDFPDTPAELEAGEIERRDQLIEIAGTESEFEKQLVLAADQFIVRRNDGNTIIAGYPWFSDWGRDTMIALSGLTLSTNREGIAKNILLEYSKHLSRGMIPNRFPDEGEEPEYNTVDATLWYVEAVRAYVEKTGDHDFVRDELYENLVEIIYWHQKGTRFNIRVDDDGLLSAGEEGWQLTWMDAKYGNEVFTPRIGKCVEIQALWYNALKTMERFAKKFKDADGKHLYGKMAKSAKTTFNKVFWDEDNEFLYDYIDGEYRDSAIRPNQIFAVSLKHSMLSMFRAKKVVQKVESELFTPRGLRTLSADDERYRPAYGGSPYKRDSAYHQGTAWAWLMGAFIKSMQRTYPKGRKSRKYVEEILNGFEEHLSEHGLGQISEIFDGDPPHAPRGCFAQAWSVAEILRIIK